VRELARGPEPIRETDVRQIHALVLGRSDRGEADRYGQRRRMIAGSTVVFPPPVEIPALMGNSGAGSRRRRRARARPSRRTRGS
jgi:Fic family protein